MKRGTFKTRGKPLKRSPFKPKAAKIKPVSAKRAAERRSKAGQDGLAYMRAVKQLPCVVCGAFGVDVHHCFHDRYGNRKVSDFDTIPLCRNCHLDGPHAIHREKAAWRERHGPDYGFIEKTRADVARACG